jgi:hypothetical protein
LDSILVSSKSSNQRFLVMEKNEEPSPPEKRAEKKKSGILKLDNVDRTISLTAFFVSAATLFILLYQTNLSHKQYELVREEQYASVMPYLVISYSSDLGVYSSDSITSYELFLSNNGLGPAFIEEVKVIYQGKTYQMDPANFLKKEIKPEKPWDFGWNDLVEGGLIPANGQVRLIKSNNRETARALYKLFIGGKQSDKVDIEIKYSSIYGTTWVIDGSGVPKEVAE